jgi:glyoxylase-like metal-dependent hydrolase (beta-lactamase superfamily II)
MHLGAAHTPGGSFVSLDERDVMFTGDITDAPSIDQSAWA